MRESSLERPFNDITLPQCYIGGGLGSLTLRRKKEDVATCALGPPSLTESIEDRLIRALRIGTVQPHQIMLVDDAIGEEENENEEQPIDNAKMMEMRMK